MQPSIDTRLMNAFFCCPQSLAQILSFSLPFHRRQRPFALFEAGTLSPKPGAWSIIFAQEICVRLMQNMFHCRITFKKYYPAFPPETSFSPLFFPFETARYFCAQALGKDLTAESNKNMSLAWICRFKSSGLRGPERTHRKGKRFGGNHEASVLSRLENRFLNHQKERS